MKKKVNILSKLPLHIRKKNSKWFINTLTGKWIHSANITKYLPKETEVKPQWQDRYYNN